MNMRNIAETTKGHDGVAVQETRMTVEKFNNDLVINVLPVTIFIGIEAVIGFVGNILILCVYTKWYAHCNFRYFVLFLAIYDLTSCLTTLPGEIFSQFHWYDYKYGWICKTKSYFNIFTAWGSAFTLLLLAFDRYRKICRPLEWQIQPSFALKLCVCGICLSSCVSVPVTILWGKQTYTFVVDGVSLNVSVCEKSETYADEIYPFIYISCVYIIPTGLMMIAVGVLNILIARKLFCKMFKHRLEKERREKQANTETKRRSSESNGKSRQNFLSMGIGRLLYYTTSIMFFNNAKTDNHQQNSDRQGSMVSLCTISLQDFSMETGGNQTEIQDLNHAQDTTNSTTSRSDKGIKKHTASEGRHFRRKWKTLIMLVLTSVFILTMALYVTLVSLVAERDNILRKLSNSEKVVFFFFWRLYFINSVINPVLYGVMDPRFRSGIKRMLSR